MADNPPLFPDEEEGIGNSSLSLADELKDAACEDGPAADALVPEVNQPPPSPPPSEESINHLPDGHAKRDSRKGLIRSTEGRPVSSSEQEDAVVSCP